jgi:hypothetical protein
LAVVLAVAEFPGRPRYHRPTPKTVCEIQGTGQATWSASRMLCTPGGLD